MEKIYIGDGIWLAFLPQKFDFEDTERPTTIGGISYLMCFNKTSNYIYLVRASK